VDPQPRRSLLVHSLRRGAFAVLALIILTGPFVIFSIMEWWAERPLEVTTHRFKGSSITFTTWYVILDPHDTARHEYWFEVRDGSRVIKKGIYYGTSFSSALVTPVQGSTNEPFGVYLIRDGRDAALVLYDPVSKTVAGRNTTDREYSDLAPTGDAAHWPERFRTAIRRHKMVFAAD
jgi:hypothetical protein